MSACLKDPPKALEAFRSLDPETRTVWVVRWQTLWLRALLEDPKSVIPEAEALTRDKPADPAGASILAIAHARAGQDTTADEARIARADRRVGHFHHVFQFLAEVHAIHGDTAGAVRFLHEASETGFPCAPCFDNDPLLAPIRGSKEYESLRQDVRRRAERDQAAVKGAL
jgi:hypothetical protein